MSTLARGTYRYFKDGEPQPVHEPWELLKTVDGRRLKGTREVSGVLMLRIEAEYEGARCKRLRLEWQPDTPDKARTLHYHHRGATLEWGAPGEATQQLPLPEGTEMFPLLRAAAGPLIRRVAKAAAFVVLPSLRDSEDSAGFLHPILSKRRADPLPATNEPGHHYRYFGGEYGEEGSDYWLNDKDLVTRYSWNTPDGIWDVRLEK